MKKAINSGLRFTLLAITIGMFIIACPTSCCSSKIPQTEVVDTLYSNPKGQGMPIQVIFRKGKTHNHPLMALWATDTNNNYIETLYIAESVAKGFFKHGDKSTGKWQPGPIRRPAALPVWAHSRGIKEEDGLFIPTQATPMPDAISGATPQHSFVLNTRLSENNPKVFILYFEINQAWDWNEYWTNNKYPTDDAYKTSCQPALVYKAIIDLNNHSLNQELGLVGHSSYNGSMGEINTELNTITTAKLITESISIKY